MIYTPGTEVTLSTAPARIPGPPAKNPEGSHDLFPGHRSNPKYGAFAPPWPPRKKNLKVVMIYSPGTGVKVWRLRASLAPPQKTLKVVMMYFPGTGVTLSMAPARIPGPPAKNPKGSHDLFPGHRSNPKYGARTSPWPPNKKP